jgi:tRNA(Ile)-lysidine synthase
MLDKVQKTILKYRLLTKGDRIIVGVSGGPDSLALLHYLTQRCTEEQIAVFAVHLNHQFRGEESDRDEQAAAEYAKLWGVPFYSKSVDVPLYIINEKLNPQVAARRVRYEYYHEIGKRVNATKIALGQQADDQAETVLMRLIRGTGMEGIGGIPILRQEGNLILIRPLLEVSKEEILDYCDQHEIQYRVDQSNLTRKYFRNQVRLDIIPFLQQYNPNIKEALIHLAEWTRVDNEWINQQTKEAMEQVTKQTGDGIGLNRQDFIGLDIALQRRLVKLILNCLSEGQMNNEGVMIEQIRSLILGDQPNFSIHLKDGMWFHRSYETITFSPEPDEEVQPYSYPLEIVGETFIPEWNGTFRAYVTSSPPPNCQNNRFIALFDLKSFSDTFEIRNRREGDRMSIRGLNGSKKVKDMFIDLKIPMYERKTLPHLVYQGEVLWIPGLRISSIGAPTENTSEFLCIEARKQHG